jgi:hypothetical protein
MSSTADRAGRGDSGRRDRATVGAAIAELVRAAEVGRARGPAGEPYTRSQVREMRAALGHVDAELGSLPMRLLRHRHVETLLEDLRAHGLSPHRERAILDALDALYAQEHVVRKERAARNERAASAQTPTDAMVALGARAARWASAMILALFVGVLLLIALTFA